MCFLVCYQARFDGALITEVFEPLDMQHGSCLMVHAAPLWWHSFTRGLILVQKWKALFCIDLLNSFPPHTNKSSPLPDSLLCFVFQWTAAFLRHMWEWPRGHRSMFCRQGERNSETVRQCPTVGHCLPHSGRQCCQLIQKVNSSFPVFPQSDYFEIYTQYCTNYPK